MDTSPLPGDPLRLFEDYLAVAGLPRLRPEPSVDPALQGKRVGLLNGASWIVLWSYYFGRMYLPGVQLISAGNDAVQLSFMQAHAKGERCPPESDIEVFVRTARDLVDLADVDGILITCSTMNRSFEAVAEAVSVPVVQIDQPMMEAALAHGGKILVVATHGPTVESTQSLLLETAQRLGIALSCTGMTVPDAWERLAVGNVHAHNELLAKAIQESYAREELGCVVLAQLSMSLFALSYPEPENAFGLPVFTSGEMGFSRMRDILTA
jgi:aspartate/glutamate racemase